MIYEKLFRQFISFLKTAKQDSLAVEDVKLINLIIGHFDELAGCGTAGGKRGKLVNQLVQQLHLAVPGDSIDFPVESETAATQELFRLQSLHTDRFRGFIEPNVFNFDKQFVLVSGPNGSGKSSLCESLEYTLLGYINEASQKRIPLNEYIKNAYFKTARIPVLKGIDEDGELVDVVADPLKYHFNFIEKCRIDAFARLSGHTASSQKELLSALFGLEQFNEFVDDFTDSIEKYIPVDPIKEKEFESKQKAIEAYQEVIKSSQDKQQKINEEKIRILRDSKLAFQFDELDQFIHGKEALTGRLYDLQQQMVATTAVMIECPSIDELFVDIRNWERHIEEFQQIQQKFDQLVKDIDFSKLYAAVLQVEDGFPEHCPVCETPLSLVNKQPFEQARSRLKDLQTAAAVEESRKEAWSTLVTAKEQIIEIIEKVLVACNAKKINTTLSIPVELARTNSASLADHKVLLEKMLLLTKEIQSKKDTLASAAATILSANQEIQALGNNKSAVVLEFESLNLLSARIKAVGTEEKTLREMTAGAKKAVQDFNDSTEQLRSEILLESVIISKNKQYIDAHKRLKRNMVTYKEQLPLQLVKDLNELAKEFYNFINRNDENYELVDSLQLPTIADQHIKISFQDQPQQLFNALQVLSEGHIKCLGLSILLAKSIYSGAGFIVLDDIVNAIDNDHRDNIRDLFLDNIHFKKKQIIITSHSEEFINEFEHKVSRQEYEDKVQKILLLKRPGKKFQK